MGASDEMDLLVFFNISINSHCKEFSLISNGAPFSSLQSCITDFSSSLQGEKLSKQDCESKAVFLSTSGIYFADSIQTTGVAEMSLSIF